MKYGPKILKQIYDLISNDEYYICDICKKVGISQDTYNSWENHRPEFAEMLQRANAERMNRFKIEARKSTLKKITGYDYDETRTVFTEGKPGADGQTKPKIKEKTVIKKHVPPDTNMLIFVLKNTDSENFKESQYIDHSTGGNPLPNSNEHTVIFKNFEKEKDGE